MQTRRNECSGTGKISRNWAWLRCPQFCGLSSLVVVPGVLSLPIVTLMYDLSTNTSKILSVLNERDVIEYQLTILGMWVDLGFRQTLNSFISQILHCLNGYSHQLSIDKRILSSTCVPLANQYFHEKRKCSTITWTLLELKWIWSIFQETKVKPKSISMRCVLFWPV